MLPEGDEWAYEPKYDGFRALAFVDGSKVFLQSRGARPLLRYFPELVFPEGRYVIDGELVILDEDGREVFDSLQARLHPAESRVKMLAEQTPALFRAFDLLAEGKTQADEGARSRSDASALKDLIASWPGKKKSASGSVELTPLTKNVTTAEPWLHSGEGVIAKQLGAAYIPGKRKGMVKIKHVRTIDVVIMGWRPGKEKGTVGSLILGLYDGKDAEADRPHLRPEGEGEARARREAEALRDRRRRQRRPEPLGHRPRARVARAPSRAGDRDHLRPHQRRPHPPRLEDHPLARRQEAARVLDRPARLRR